MSCACMSLQMWRTAAWCWCRARSAPTQPSEQRSACACRATPSLSTATLSGARMSSHVQCSAQLHAPWLHSSVHLHCCPPASCESSSHQSLCVGRRVSALAAEDADTAALISSDGVWEENGKWRNVQDFGWLKASQSPHWCARLSCCNGKPVLALKGLCSCLTGCSVPTPSSKPHAEINRGS